MGTNGSTVSIWKKIKLQVSLLFVIIICHKFSTTSVIKYSFPKYFSGLISSSCCLSCWAEEPLPWPHPWNNSDLSIHVTRIQQREQSWVGGWSEVPWMAAEDKSGELKTGIEFEILEWLAWVGRDVGIETTSLIPILYIQTLLLVTN